MTLSPLGDSAVVVHLGGLVNREMAQRVRNLAEELREARLPGVTDVVPAFASVAVFFDDCARPEEVEAGVRTCLGRAGKESGRGPARHLEVPVVYGGEAGPDLEAVAAQAGLSAAEVIRRHAAAEYLVHAIGFAPGFPYLGGLAAELATPRRSTPRARVPAGSVGIGGAQTGVYPLETPGGWNLIGRTPLRLFEPRRPEPALLRAGDVVRFRAVPAEAGALDGNGATLVSREPVPAEGIEVLRPGMYTTVQDVGRPGHRAEGVPVGGAADATALRLANLLVGNEEGAAGLEFTLVGPELRFAVDTWVALTGAVFEGFPAGRPWPVRAGETLRFGEARCGCRGYLAVAGGIDVPLVLGSRSTLARAGFGGLEGRVLRTGDHLPLRRMRGVSEAHWQVDPRALPDIRSRKVLRVVRGEQAEEFSAEEWRREFTVSRQSDRMGVRLDGQVVARKVETELISAAVAPGTVQVPPDGRPIVLLAEAQTIGGYPQLAHVIAVDLPLAAQLRPGEVVRFEEVSLAEAQTLRAARQRSLALLRAGLKEKWA